MKTVHENVDNLTFRMVEDFLCTFDSACETNIEFSQWSNEMLYTLCDKEPDLVFKVLEQSQLSNIEIQLDAMENPIHNFDYQRIYVKIKDTETKSEFQEKILKSIEVAAAKKGIEIKK